MDKHVISELKYIKNWLEENKDFISYESVDPITRIFINPRGMTGDRYKFRLEEINECLAKEERLDNVYLGMAKELSNLSHAERAKVGCLIVNSEGQIVSQGYNGTPSGFDNCCEEEHDGKLTTKHEVLHAESNAISKCAKWGGSTDGATLYVTMSPCYECAKLIIQAGIKRVVYTELYRDKTGIELLEKAGIEVNHYINGKQQL